MRRWRSSRWRTLAALLAVVVLAILAGVLLLSGGGDDGSALRSYYFQAHLDVQSQGMVDESVLDTVRGWWQSPDRWRWDIFDSAHPDQATVMLPDGDRVLEYDGKTNTYYYIESPSGFYGGGPDNGPPVLPASVNIGPVAGGDVDVFLAAEQASGFAWRQVGGEDVLGHQTRVIELTSPSGGTSKLWVDDDLGLVLRYELTDPQQSVHVEMTELQVNQAIDHSVFQFQPPADAVEVQQTGQSSGSGSSGPGGLAVPDGFLQPAYVPDRLRPGRVQLGAVGARHDY